MRRLRAGRLAHRLGADHGGVGLFLLGQRIDLDDVGVFQLAGLVFNGQLIGARAIVGERRGVQSGPGLSSGDRIGRGTAALHEGSGGDTANQQRTRSDQRSSSCTFHNRLLADDPQRS
ncbi:hypothetical protein D3C71_1724580 [compost metagenome]